MIITRKRVISFVFLSLFGLLQFAGFAFFAKPVSADEALLNSQVGIREISGTYGKGPGNPPTDIRVIIVNIIQVILGFLAVIFFGLVIYAGFQYMTAAGNDDQTKKAISQITNATIGLLIILVSWILTTALIRYLTRAVNNSVQLFD